MSNNWVDIVKHERPMVVGAFLAMSMSIAVKSVYNPFLEKNNLYVVYAPCMLVASGVKVFNDSGVSRETDTSGVIYDPPSHWTIKGTTLRVVIEEQIYVLEVTDRAMLLVPNGCPNETEDK